jgi:integrase
MEAAVQQAFFPQIYICNHTQSKRDTSNYKKNYKTGESQEVFPLKNKEQIQAMSSYYLKEKNYRDLLIFTMGINIGLRAGDLLSLKIGDICDETGCLKHINDKTDTNDKICVLEDKTDKHRTFFLNKACIDALTWYFNLIGYTETMRAELLDQYLFLSREGNNQHITVDMLRKSLKIAAQNCGIKQNIGTHTLRKTFGYWQYVANANNPRVISLLQRLFNHSSELITLRYIGILEEDDKALYNNVNLFTIGSESVPSPAPQRI